MAEEPYDPEEFEEVDGMLRRKKAGFTYRKREAPCANCGNTENTITDEKCRQCGANLELSTKLGGYVVTTDQQDINLAENASLRVCKFCGAVGFTLDRKSGERKSKNCSNCGADEFGKVKVTKQDSQPREIPDVVGQPLHSTRPNYSNLPKPSRFWWFEWWHLAVAVGVVVLIAFIWWIVYLSGLRYTVDAEVKNFYWEYSIPMEKYGVVSFSDRALMSELPRGAKVTNKWKEDENRPIKTGKFSVGKQIDCVEKDLENGFTKQGNECYEKVPIMKDNWVKIQYCSWEIWDWVSVNDPPTESGYDRSPRWPQYHTNKSFRLKYQNQSDWSKSHSIIFRDTTGKVWPPRSYNEWEWKNFDDSLTYTITYDGLGFVVSILPKSDTQPEK